MKQARILLEKNKPGTIAGKLQFASLEIVGNQWEQGVVAGQDGELRDDTGEYMRVSAKDQLQLRHLPLCVSADRRQRRIFNGCIRLVQSSYQLGVTERREQSLSLEYGLDPDSLGVTWRRVEGQRQGDGADLSKHQTLKIWVYNPAGRPTGAALVLRLSAALRSNNIYSYRYSGSANNEDEQQVNVFKELDDYYEYTLPIDFTGWKQAVISIADEDRDGHPDGLRAVGSPSLTNVGGVVLGIQNETGETMEGELWVNDIYLADPLVQSGWARRGGQPVSAREPAAGAGERVEPGSGF